MARGRMIDKRVSNSKKLGKISDRAARLYFMVYPHLDSDGRIAFDDLEDLKTEIIPYLKGWALKKIRVSLNELADTELITLYPFNKKIAMHFERFEDFQTIRKNREAPSRIKPARGTPEYSGAYRISPALSLSLSLSLRKEGKGRNTTEQIDFSFPERKFLNIKIEDKAGWKDAYPAVDIDQEIRIAREWLLANPTRAKSNYRQFLNNWFRREQQKGGSQRFKRAEGGRPMTRKEERKEKIKKWTEKPEEK